MSKKTSNVIFFTVVFSVAFLIFPPDVFAVENNSLDFPIGLKIGETANINSELKMTLLDIEDSRCPVDVTCIWEGTVLVKIQLKKGVQDLGIHTIPMETMEDTEQTFDGYYIRLTNVEPYPASTVSIQPTDYVLTFFVSLAETNSIDSPLNQFNNGIPFNEIKCSPGLQLTQRYDGRPACVSSETYLELIKRDWVSDIIKAVQSGDFFDQDQNTIQPVIKTGTNSGFCLGYCSKEFVIMPEKITYTQSGRDVPDKTKHIPFSKSSWNELVNLVDFKKFDSLPDRIGCPGCADAPVEWIEIKSANKTKKIEFESGDNIPEIKKLILTLEKIRSPIESSIEDFEDCAAAGNTIMESYPRQCMTSDGRNFVEEIDAIDTPNEIKEKRSTVNVPDATNENDLFCQTLWNIETTEKLDKERIKNSVQSTIAQFGITYFLEDREIIVSESPSGYVVSISGLWDSESVQYSMITEDLENISGVDVHGKPAMCT
ncbi:hypothetical protein YTPLAS73_10950 [Nitrosarchaeum sp.]|nr:hypothetical protein YTPLAS73_10950 [Nitrosarchaeum sp.]